MADNLVNQSLDRRREERAAEQLIQDNVTRLADLATTNMEIWQKYFGFGAQVAHYWADALNAAQNSIAQTISTIQSRRAGVNQMRTVEERAALLPLPSAALVRSQTWNRKSLALRSPAWKSCTLTEVFVPKSNTKVSLPPPPFTLCTLPLAARVSSAAVSASAGMA